MVACLMLACCAERDGCVLGMGLRRVGQLRVWCGLAAGGMAARPMQQACTERDDCASGAGLVRVVAPETAESARILLNSTDGGRLCLRF